MITFADAFLLAQTKLKIRKWRTAFTVLTTAIGLILLMTVTIATAGLIRTAYQLFSETNDNRWFAVTSYNRVERGDPQAEGFRPNTQTWPLAATDPSVFQQAHPGHQFQSIFYQTTSHFDHHFLLQSPDAPPLSATDYFTNYNLFVTDPVFIQSAIADGYSFDAAIDGAIPVVIPADSLLSDHQDRTENDARLQYETVQRLSQAVIGQRFTLTRVEYNPSTDTSSTQPLPVTVEVVGVIGGSGSNLLNTNAIILPAWAIVATPALQELFAVASEQRVVTEFPSAQARDAFVDEVQATFTQPAAGTEPVFDGFTMIAPTQLQEFTSGLKIVRRVLIGIGSFVVVLSALFIMTMLGKVIADNRKEIALFRAVGAQKNDIRRIYFCYTWLVVTGAYVVSLVAAFAICTAASWWWGDNVFYELADASPLIAVQPPRLLFVRLDWLPLLLIYIGALTAAFLAALFPLRRATKIEPMQVLKDV